MPSFISLDSVLSNMTSSHRAKFIRLNKALSDQPLFKTKRDRSPGPLSTGEKNGRQIEGSNRRDRTDSQDTYSGLP